jgi:site-specific recombinase XerD
LETEIWYGANDRTLHEWLKLAGRWDSKTISAKLASIRQFEAFCLGKSFGKITTADATSFREGLKSSVEAADADQRSISTVRHCASHLKSFFEWLVDQKGYHGLNRSLPNHFVPPKKLEAMEFFLHRRKAALSPNCPECPNMFRGIITKNIKHGRQPWPIQLISTA